MGKGTLKRKVDPEKQGENAKKKRNCRGRSEDRISATVAESDALPKQTRSRSQSVETMIPCGNKGEKSSVKQGRFTAKKNEKSHKNNNAVLKHADKRTVKERSHYLKSNEFRSGNEDPQIPHQNEIDVSETVYPTDYDCLGDGIE